MTTINTHCPECGEVTLTPDDIDLRVGIDGTDEGFYAFGCPRCHLLVRKHADARVVRLLRSAGVPWRVLGRDDVAEAPAFTYDDLLDLHELLATDGWFDALLTDGRGELDRGY